jgi:hypothetical protein
MPKYVIELESVAVSGGSRRTLHFLAARRDLIVGSLE